MLLRGNGLLVFKTDSTVQPTFQRCFLLNCSFSKWLCNCSVLKCHGNEWHKTQQPIITNPSFSSRLKAKTNSGGSLTVLTLKKPSLVWVLFARVETQPNCLLNISSSLEVLNISSSNLRRSLLYSCVNLSACSRALSSCSFRGPSRGLFPEQSEDKPKKFLGEPHCALKIILVHQRCCLLSCVKDCCYWSPTANSITLLTSLLLKHCNSWTFLDIHLIFPIISHEFPF